MTTKKPVIYLYPTAETIVDIHVNFQGKLKTLYPHYNAVSIEENTQHWRINVSPKGIIKDPDTQKEYSPLFWDGDYQSDFNFNEGNIIKGSKTIQFLEDTLYKLELSIRERTEFIQYWLPSMESNPWNFIYFAKNNDDYFQKTSLEVNPIPDSVIRVMMFFKPFNEKEEIIPQSFPDSPPNRSGFILVEWGGSILPLNGNNYSTQ